MKKGTVIYYKAEFPFDAHNNGYYVVLNTDSSEIGNTEVNMLLLKEGVLQRGIGTTTVNINHNKGINITSMVYNFDKDYEGAIATVHKKYYEQVEMIINGTNENKVEFVLKDGCKSKGYVVLKDEKYRADALLMLNKWNEENSKQPPDKQFVDFFKIL